MICTTWYKTAEEGPPSVTRIYFFQTHTTSGLVNKCLYLWPLRNVFLVHVWWTCSALQSLCLRLLSGDTKPTFLWAVTWELRGDVLNTVVWSSHHSFQVHCRCASYGSAIRYSISANLVRLWLKGNLKALKRHKMHWRMVRWEYTFLQFCQLHMRNLMYVHVFNIAMAPILKKWCTSKKVISWGNASFAELGERWNSLHSLIVFIVFRSIPNPQKQLSLSWGNQTLKIGKLQKVNEEKTWKKH